MKLKKKLGELLLDGGIIDEFQLKSALSYQEEWGGRLGSILIKKGFVSEQEMLSVIEKQYGLSSVSLETVGRPPDEVLNMVKVDVAKKFGIFPVRLEGGKVLLVATADPTDLKTLDDISFMLGVRVKPLLALESDILRAIGIYYEGNFSPAHILTKEKLAEFDKTVMHDKTVIHDRADVHEPVHRREHPAGKARAEISQKIVLESLIDLLVSKGVFTRDELIRKMKSRNQPQSS